VINTVRPSCATGLFCCDLQPGPARISGKVCLGSVRHRRFTATRAYFAMGQGGKASLRVRCRVDAGSHCVALDDSPAIPGCLFPTVRPASQFHSADRPVHRWIAAACRGALKAARLESGVEERGSRLLAAAPLYATQPAGAGNGTCASSHPCSGHKPIAQHHSRLRPHHQGGPRFTRRSH